MAFPSSVTCLGKSMFNFCEKLVSVVIPDNPNIQIIEKGTFAYSSIKCISIPSNIMQISKSAFFGCSKLQIAEIQGCADLENIKSTFLNCYENIIIMIQNE